LEEVIIVVVEGALKKNFGVIKLVIVPALVPAAGARGAPNGGPAGGTPMLVSLIVAAMGARALPPSLAISSLLSVSWGRPAPHILRSSNFLSLQALHFAHFNDWHDIQEHHPFLLKVLQFSHFHLPTMCANMLAPHPSSLQVFLEGGW
jgi:hypothetical protein